MKILKIGFATLVAIIAVGLTIAAQAGAFESKKILAGTESDCFDVRSGSGTPIEILDAECLKQQLDQTIPCPGSALNGFGIFTDLTAHAVVGNPGLDCPGSAQVCCVEVEVDPVPCLDIDPPQNQSTLPTTAKYYQVKAIRCTQN